MTGAAEAIDSLKLNEENTRVQGGGKADICTRHNRIMRLQKSIEGVACSF